MTLRLTLMGETTRRELARKRTVHVLKVIRENIGNDPTVNVTSAAEAAGVAPSSFYRWLATPPQKIDVTQVAAVADYLHDEYGHSDFASLWRDAQSLIKE